jgi:hypothetical protein
MAALSRTEVPAAADDDSLISSMRIVDGSMVLAI